MGAGNNLITYLRCPEDKERTHRNLGAKGLKNNILRFRLMDG